MRMAYAKRSTGLAVVVVAFLAYSLPPYFTGGTRVPSTFALHYPLLVGHVMFGGVAMAAAVLQIWPGLRTRRPALHRRVGRIYVVTAVAAGVCALAIGAATPFGPLLAVSNVFLASLWLWLTINGYLAARQRRYADHRRHMVGSATLALSVITNRIWTPILFITLQPLRDSAFSGNAEHYLWLVAGLGAWLGWTIPFVSVQWWLRRESVTPPIPQPTDTSRV
ncbi:DUF2306 domain-containing protein [Mycobacterium sp. 1081908.1]|uniref:DUF2306 domain-containing protein n=1 Tax=Mycobacterium sp. 1081908.1 TaxID=1834066 RepID=UPI0007FC1075|nr:DUF2306 domain-containing protein [Mycobacterium sp. 1081908.1]OBK45734.1 hypothetical protein A5655_11545 [Mycobacterium sp. 1081908.1]